MSDSTVKHGRFRVTATDANCAVTVSDAAATNAADGDGDDAFDRDTVFQEGWDACRAECDPKIAALESQVAALQNELDTLTVAHTELTQSASRTTCDLADSVTAYMKVLEDELIDVICDLSFAVADGIIRREAERSTIITDVVREAIAMTVHLTDIKVYLNPEDLEKIESDCGVQIPPSLDMIADPTLDPGELRMDTSQGGIDATIAGRMDALRSHVVTRIKAANHDCDSPTGG